MQVMILLLDLLQIKCGHGMLIEKRDTYESDLLPIEEKESYRWIKCANDAKEVLNNAKKYYFY